VKIVSGMNSNPYTTNERRYTNIVWSSPFLAKDRSSLQ